MIDIHTHIIPQFDDGASSWEMALEMLKQSERDGVSDVVATSHILSDVDADRELELLEKFKKLQQKAKEAHISVRLHLGCEMYMYPEMPLDRPFSTIAGTGKYILLEFPMNAIPVFAGKRFFELIVDGVTPVLAHPERNLNIMRKPQLAFEFVQRGVLMQINAGSLLGYFGKHIKTLAIHLLEANLAHVVASDAHNNSSRASCMSEAFDFVKIKWGNKAAQRLFVTNPGRILKGEPVEHVEPKPLSDVKTGRTSIFSWLRKN